MAKNKKKKGNRLLILMLELLVWALALGAVTATVYAVLHSMRPIFKNCDGVEIHATAVRAMCIEGGTLEMSDMNGNLMYVNLDVSPRVIHGDETVQVGVNAWAHAEDGSRPFIPVCQIRDNLHSEFRILSPNGDPVEVSFDYNQDVLVICNHDDGNTPILEVEMTVPIQVYP